MTEDEVTGIRKGMPTETCKPDPPTHSVAEESASTVTTNNKYANQHVSGLGHLHW